MIQVVCAVIKKNNSILICQRSSAMKLPLKWEFPGGKVEKNETFPEGLVREIKEELGLHIKVNKTLTPVKHHYSEFSIELIPFISEILGGELNPIEHKEVKWETIDNLTNYDWAAADIPIVEEIIKLWS